MSNYKVTNDTSYNSATKQSVIDILEYHRQLGTRLKFHYGDTETGLAWGDIEVGRIGRSAGDVKVPLIISNSRCLGGGALLDHCVIKIEYANKKDGGVIYQHPDFKSE